MSYLIIKNFGPFKAGQKVLPFKQTKVEQDGFCSHGDLVAVVNTDSGLKVYSLESLLDEDDCLPTNIFQEL